MHVRRVNVSLTVLLAAGLLFSGCVIRSLTIRSEPTGAPVYLDEREVGRTPVTVEFDHYGTREVRVGPVADEKERITYGEQVEMVKTPVPWYEYFPLDFFSELIIPWTIRDQHVVDVKLPRKDTSEAATEQEVNKLIDKASKFRQDAQKGEVDTE